MPPYWGSLLLFLAIGFFVRRLHAEPFTNVPTKVRVPQPMLLLRSCNVDVPLVTVWARLNPGALSQSLMAA